MTLGGKDYPNFTEEKLNQRQKHGFESVSMAPQSSPFYHQQFLSIFLIKLDF